MPLRLPNTQLPPTRSDFSKQSNGSPALVQRLGAAMPEDPAPITQTLGSSAVMDGSVRNDDGGVKFSRAGQKSARGTQIHLGPPASQGSGGAVP